MAFMSDLVILYGSATGHTEAAAQKIRQALGRGRVLPVSQFRAEDLKGLTSLVLGCSTWGVGDLQEDWEQALLRWPARALEGKTVALFGLGDQESFADTFLDGLGILYDAAVIRGAQVVGTWPTDGYYFSASKALRQGRFVGLGLDEDTQPDQSDDRIRRWTAELKTLLP